MNQLLVSGKVYMTPELKKKKIAYKGYLLLSVFVVAVNRCCSRMGVSFFLFIDLLGEGI